jgi:hypothetical protein
LKYAHSEKELINAAENEIIYYVDMWFMEKKRVKKFMINAVTDNEKRDLFEIEINGMKKINFMLKQFQHDY